MGKYSVPFHSVDKYAIYLIVSDLILMINWFIIVYEFTFLYPKIKKIFYH